MYTLKGTDDENGEFVKNIYENHYKYFWRYAYYLTKNVETSNDLINQTFANFISTMERLELRRRLSDDISVKSYIKKMIYYLFLDEQKSRKAELKYLEQAHYLKQQENLDTSNVPIEKILDFEVIRQASQTLTKKEKDVILFAYKFDLKRKDIAKIMNISENNVYVTLHLALKKLKNSILDGGEE